MSDAPMLILASASPRRRALLEQIGRPPDRMLIPHIDESIGPGELPRSHAERLAREKALAVAGREAAAGHYVLAADTVVACGRRILPKAEDADTARKCLRLLSGRRHRVVGGICILTPDGRPHERLVVTTVTFKRLSAGEIQSYLDTGEWEGKAGGYAIQGRAAVFVQALGGSYSNVVGLALYECNQLLTGLGLPASWLPGGE